MSFDPKSNLTYATLFASKAQATNNTASSGVDLRGYEGAVCVRVNIGILTAGDNNSTCTLIVQSAANNTASEATNISGATNVAFGSAANNTATAGTISVDPRACYRYLFGRLIFTGSNSPNVPVAADVIGVKQTQ